MTEPDDTIERMAAALRTSVSDVRNCMQSLSVTITESSTKWQDAMASFDSIDDVIKAEKRRQKAIDRIAWKAEAAQRRAKGMHFK
jgi:hypothetical protein